MTETDVVIVGSGPIGLFTVFQAGMLGMRTHVIETLDFVGGQCAALYPEKPIYDIPGYPEITALALVEKLKEQAAPFNPTYHLGQQAVSFDKTADNRFIVYTNKDTIVAKVIIIAAGSGAFGPNKPPLHDIERYENKTVFYAVNNQNIFRGKNVAIAGGGDSALDWAIILADIAKNVYLIHRREKFRGHDATIQKIRKLANAGKIKIVAPYQLDNLVDGGNDDIKAIEVKDLDGHVKQLDAQFLLAFFGLRMDLGPLAKWGLELEHNHICVDPLYYQTNLEGIYAVGDIAKYEGKLKLILTGFAETASALHHAYPKVFDGKALHFQYSTSKGIK